MVAWGPVIAAGMGGGFGIGGNLIAAAANKSSARQQMAFQERMYRHRYRYTMQDLRKAGINPILAAEVGGGGAPSGAGYTMPNPFAEAAGAVADLPEKVLGYSAKQTENEILKSEALTAERDAERAFNEAGSSHEQYKMDQLSRRLFEATFSTAVDKATADLDETNSRAQAAKASAAVSSSAAEAAERDNAFYREHPWMVPIEKAVRTIPRFGIDVSGPKSEERHTTTGTGRSTRTQGSVRQSGRSVRVGR